MTEDHISNLKDKITQIKEKGHFIPTKISQIDELEGFQNYREILLDLRLKDLTLEVLNIYTKDYSSLVPKNVKRNNLILALTPFIVAILTCIYGIYIGKYWLIISLPLVVVGQFLSASLNSKLTYVVLLVMIVLAFVLSNTTIGLLLINFFITILFSTIVKVHRTRSLMTVSLSDESIFCYCFYFRIIRLFDNRESRFIIQGKAKL